MADKEVWEGGTYETDPVKLEDDRSGSPIIVRRFSFKFPPDIEDFPTEEEILDEQMKRLEIFLWKDGFRLIQEPRVIIDTKKKTYDIFATCQVDKGNVLLDTPMALQDIVKPNDTRGDKG